jgi:DNA-binding response OmpR family regulator
MRGSARITLLERAVQSGGMNMKASPILTRHDRPALRTALESAGFLVFEGTDGGREREQLREFWSSLILLDLPMPRMGGLEVFRRLRGAGDDGPEAIVVTHGRIPEATAVLRLGVIDVLARPMTAETLRAVVDRILRPAGSLSGPNQPRILVAVEPLILELLRAKRALDHREFEAAERLFRRVIDRDPRSAVAHNLMGVLHQRLGEHHAAYHSFKAAVRVDPNYEAARENLRRQCSRLGLDYDDSCRPGVERSGGPDPIGRADETLEPEELAKLYDRSHRYLGLDSGLEPSHGPTRKRGC